MNAIIEHNDQKYDIKIKLKGLYLDHLKGDKWSFRIHIKGDDHLFGMRRFSIQHPRTRNYESEILFFETLPIYHRIRIDWDCSYLPSLYKGLFVRRRY